MAECEPNQLLFEDFGKICRTCLNLNAESNVFCKKVEIDNNNFVLAELLLKCGSVQISEQDGLPQQICRTCEDVAIKSVNFRSQCEASEKYLQTIFQKVQISKNSDTLMQEFDDCDNIGAEETITLTVEKYGEQFVHSLDESKTSFSNEFEENSISSENHGEILIKHIQTESYKCLPCDTTFESFTDYSTHQCHQKLPKSKDLKKRTCPHCNKVFQYRTSMLKHQKKHTAPPKTCPYCPFQPSSPSTLSKHMEQAHSHLKTFTCFLCNKAFFKKANLRLHVQMHSGVKKHTCEICGLSFVLKGNLSVHTRLHTGERPYTCSVCGRGFTQQSALRSHEAGHSDRRDHVCQECGAAFSRAGALRNHQKRHSSARPFECSICGKKFTFSSERKRHVLIHSGDKNYECEVCGRRFTRKTNLKVHKRIHTGETPHVCKVCGKGFIQAHCLRTHMNTHVVN